MVGPDGDWRQGDGSIADRLTLADWRRRVAELYAEVRAMAATHPLVALAHWRAVRETLFRTHPQSPVPTAARVGFHARHYDPDLSLRFEATIEPGPDIPQAGSAATAVDLALPNSGDGGALSFTRVGTVRLPLPGGDRQLAVFWMRGYAGGLFIPFRDATNGSETYAAGRYLVDAAKSADLGGDPDHGSVILDFNFAYHPSCAFDARWACPLAPPENRLDIPIRAGERLP